MTGKRGALDGHPKGPALLVALGAQFLYSSPASCLAGCSHSLEVCVCVCQQKKYIMIHSSNGAMSTHMASVVGTGIWEHREGTLGELGGF